MGLQLKIMSTDMRLKGKFIYHTWSQALDGLDKPVNRLMATKLSTGSAFNQDRFKHETVQILKQQLTYIVDSHFRLKSDNVHSVKDLELSRVEARSINYVDHRVDVEESPNYKGLASLYHLYTVEVECDGL